MGQPGVTHGISPGGVSDNFSLRAQLRRRSQRGHDFVTGESPLSKLALDQFEAALRSGDKELLDVARKAIEEIDGPQRQAVDHAITYSIVEIVGEIIEEDPPASTDGTDMP